MHMKNDLLLRKCARDCKSGGYNMEATQVYEQRLNILILLIAIAYTSAIIQGGFLKQVGVQKYICRVKEPRRIEQRHSTFHVCLSGQTWSESVEQHQELVSELIKINLNKRLYYQRGQRAVKLMTAA